jgi:hypothetical protein
MIRLPVLDPQHSGSALDAELPNFWVATCFTVLELIELRGFQMQLGCMIKLQVWDIPKSESMLALLKWQTNIR